MKPVEFKFESISGIGNMCVQAAPEFAEVKKYFPALLVGASEVRHTVPKGHKDSSKRSWRNFLLGAKAIARLKDGRIFFVDGYNVKETAKPNCPTRCCAEEMIMKKLKKINEVLPIQHIIAFAIVGDYQVDDESGVSCSTTHPCGSCRRKMAADMHMRDTTLIFTFTAPNEKGEIDFGEVHTHKDMIAKHHTPDAKHTQDPIRTTRHVI